MWTLVELLCRLNHQICFCPSFEKLILLCYFWDSFQSLTSCLLHRKQRILFDSTWCVSSYQLSGSSVVLKALQSSLAYWLIRPEYSPKRRLTSLCLHERSNSGLLLSLFQFVTAETSRVCFLLFLTRPLLLNLRNLLAREVSFLPMKLFFWRIQESLFLWNCLEKGFNFKTCLQVLSDLRKHHCWVSFTENGSSFWFLTRFLINLK